MKNSKVVLLALSFGALMLVSWAMPTATVADNTMDNVTASVDMPSMNAEMDVEPCWAYDSCWPIVYQPIIIAGIQGCYGWPTGGQPESCKCFDLNNDGAVNILDLVTLSSRPCP